MIGSHIMMLASPPMTATRRTTVTARATDLDTLSAEATRRGVSQSTVLAEAVQDKASALRARRRPAIGVAASEDGRSAAETTAEPIAHPPR